MPVHRVEIESRPELPDPVADRAAARLSAWLGCRPAELRTRKVLLLDLDVDGGDAERIRVALTDPVAEISALGSLEDRLAGGDAEAWLEVGLRPGVTDAVGRTVGAWISDRLGRPLSGAVHSATLYLFRGLSLEDVQRAADQALHNPLIQHAHLGRAPRAPIRSVARAGSQAVGAVATVPLRDATDERLMELSRRGMLALELHEMRAIAAYYRQLARDPTDAELECLAQTWSEHCKHKIFASPIDYVGPDGAARTIDRGLFRTYIRGATEAVAQARIFARQDPPDAPFLVSVFHDNAGVVRCTDRDHLVFKVETHNSPSALDPYGGAMTGIVGVNRDSFGTGIGADLLANVWGYCLGAPDHAGALPRGLMPPRRVRDGVHAGVADGGNHSGIPYARGFELFDPRYAGKPLVYCGTVAVMPVERAGRPAHDKSVCAGDVVVMVGGRIGKDGIHGATFSSAQLDDDSPVQAVQIGDPLVQKMMFDLLAQAADEGLYRAITDNGAGGLSSSVGEMATHCGGAEIDLEAAPVKYPGLQPWEILVSEAQERMTLAVPPERVERLLSLAAAREVEATVLGTFTATGRFVVRHGETPVCDLPLEFLHDGVPLPTLRARWERGAPGAATMASADAVAEAIEARGGLSAVVTAVLSGFNLVTDVDRHRTYDHEVKGLSVVKPLVGIDGDVPASASVMRLRHDGDTGVVLAEGIHPWYSDDDTYAMAQACVDEALRRVLCAGARYDRVAALDNFCWPDPIVSDRTPDGAHKLAQLVRCCEGLYGACVAYGVPLISGKDSMKNDAFMGGVKISIPPTLLVSAMGQIEDVARALTLEPLEEGEWLFVLGATRDGLGMSELSRVLALPLGAAPLSQPSRWAPIYRAFSTLCAGGQVAAAVAPGRGGLAYAFASMLRASPFSLDVDLGALIDDAHPDPRIAPAVALLSEATGRIVLSVPPGRGPTFAEALRTAVIESGGEGADLVLHDVGRVVASAQVAERRLHVRAGAWQADWGVHELGARWSDLEASSAMEGR